MVVKGKEKEEEDSMIKTKMTAFCCFLISSWVFWRKCAGFDFVVFFSLSLSFFIPIGRYAANTFEFFCSYFIIFYLCNLLPVKIYWSMYLPFEKKSKTKHWQVDTASQGKLSNWIKNAVEKTFCFSVLCWAFCLCFTSFIFLPSTVNSSLTRHIFFFSHFHLHNANIK